MRVARSYTKMMWVSEIEHGFSLVKHCYGLGLIRIKFDAAVRRLICLSVIAMNIDKLSAISLYMFLKTIFHSLWRDCFKIKSAQPCCSDLLLSRYYIQMRN